MATPAISLQSPPSYPESQLPAPIQRLERPVALVKVRALAFLMFEKPDLLATAAFMTDFGLHAVLHSVDQLQMRSSGSSPCIYLARKGKRSRYLGAAFNVASTADLLVLQREGGARPLPTSVIPGGGEGVELVDPAGNLLWFVTGQRELSPLPVRAPLHDAVNAPGILRRVNATVRPPLEPAAVVRLGHVVMQTVDFAGMATWYMRHLGLIPTDVQFLSDGSPNLGFFRFDLGDEPADHHSVVLVGGIEEKYEHSAYEVVDLDAIGHGHNVLRAQGHRPMWGIGRHLLGSQMFDYWYDPDGMEFEHYADGDVFTADYETHYVPLNLSGIWAWGNDAPSTMAPRPSLGNLLKVARLLSSGRLSFARLKLLGQAMSAPARPWL